MKLMLEKTTDKMSKETSSEEQATAAFAPPSAADIARIEGESFEPASFISHRTAKKVKRGGGGGREGRREMDIYNILSVLNFTYTGSQIWSGWSQETL